MIISLALVLALFTQPPAVDARIDTILEELEARGATVNDLQCKVKYTIEDLLADDTIEKKGEIRYKRKTTNPLFYIHFNMMIQAGEVDRESEWYVFDGQDLWEIKEAAKNKVQHSVVKPGEAIDLFDIEESPIPIPFGQKKAQIQKNFVVVLMDPKPGDPPNTDHLLCKPKPDSPLMGDIHALEFFISRELKLPIKIVQIERGGNRINTAAFPDLSAKSLNSGLDDALFALPEESRKWKTVKPEGN